MTLKTVRTAALAVLAAALAFPLALPLSAAPEKRAVTIDDLQKVKGVAEPSIAPDGRSVAFAVTTTIKQMKHAAIKTLSFFIIPHLS